MTLEPLDVPPALPHAGRLLVAAPAMTDPNFARTVVFLLDHDEDGTLGVVLNRPSHVPVGAVLPPWDGRTTGTDVVFDGGPVAEDSALGLALLPGPVDGPGARRLPPRRGPVRPRRPRHRPGRHGVSALNAIRIFAGYAGWAEGQLADEIARGDWYVVDGGSDDVFATDTADLWHRVLRRQPGDLAFLATPSVDPSLN